MMAAALVAVTAMSAASPPGDGPVLPSAGRLANVADRMRISLSIAAVAAFSPSVADAHGHAERLIVLLRGNGDDRPTGLLQDVALFADWIAARSFDPEREQALRAACANVQQFLRMALEASLSANRTVWPKGGGRPARVYAYLAAAQI
jgi:hypothetical protein